MELAHTFKAEVEVTDCLPVRRPTRVNDRALTRDQQFVFLGRKGMRPDPISRRRRGPHEPAGGIDQGPAIRGPIILAGALLAGQMFLQGAHIQVVDRPRARRLRVLEAVGQVTPIR